MRVVIIGGSGHVGTYLVPHLVEAGYEVINVTRGKSKPYLPHAAWNAVQQVTLDREAAERDGVFGERIAALQPDVVIDMVCFTEVSARQIVPALRGKIQHFLHCGTMWVHGSPVQQPTTEDAPRRPLPKYNLSITDVDDYLLTDYGAQKAAIEAYLLDEARRGAFPATVLHPGHIVGPGHLPINPQGNGNPTVFETLARGDELLLPNIGLETVHHVHGDDVAQAFQLALQRWSVSIGEAFHVVSPAALTLRGYANRWRRGLANPPRCASSVGKNFASASPNAIGQPRGIISPTAPTAVSPRRSACLAISRATVRCKRSTKRWNG